MIDRDTAHGAVDVLYRGTVDVALIRDQYGGFWDDNACTTPARFFCERDH